MDTGLIVGMVLLGLFGGYLITSVLLLKYPLILHKRKQLKFRCRHICHRGGAGERLENSMSAFKHACHIGTDMLEIDCHITKDGQVVVTHDNNLQRLTGCDVLVSETNYEDLPLLKPELRLDFDFGWVTRCSSDNEEDDLGQRRITLLREVFEQFPNTVVNIDIKVDNDELIQSVANLISEFNRESLTVWGNKSGVVTNKCYTANPNIPVLASIGTVVKWVILFYTGLLPFIPIREAAYEIVMPSVILKEGKTRFQLSTKQRALLKFIDWLLMSKQMIQHLSERGIQTYIWVLNEEDEFEKAFQLGATGVMTDFPTKLKQYLEPGHVLDNKT
ncbi:lysophospholipase D GDPD1 [Lingula anatina]|uniref:Lysophospholipase D GDPD1 n=1 Tax=Lingula anatina TaxID=7574 RepID=A0A1S3I1L3_LINAN|nr:lysophospholipase D GDPD1 [Lingula anatina]|eukprot:XP_013392157.2 lysophospholipase D GDPD1 [Lingula anatina]